MESILVTDDDRNCRYAIQKILERQGYAVESAADINSALQALERKSFDLIVCDYRMEGETGLDLLAELSKRSRRIPVLMVSGCADFATERAAALGITKLLKKPVRRQDLLNSVAEGLALGLTA